MAENEDRHQFLTALLGVLVKISKYRFASGKWEREYAPGYNRPRFFDYSMKRRVSLDELYVQYIWWMIEEIVLRILCPPVGAIEEYGSRDALIA